MTTATWRGKTIAESDRTLEVGGYIYFPRDTVRMKKVRKFGAAIWGITGKGNDVDFVFEHPGEQTFPVSCNIVKRGGM